MPMTTNSVPESQPILTEPATNAAPESVNTNAAAAAPVVDTNMPPPVDTTPPGPRIVTHEGVVGFSASLNAPTDFKLYDPDTLQDIDFLYTNAKDLDLNRYVNMRIVVTGVEGLDARWQNTPVITIERIRVIDTNAVKNIPIKHAH
jgi:hypothetical protein